MMQKIVLALLIGLTLVACSSEPENENLDQEENLVDNFTISGTIEGAANQALYLEAQSQGGTISVASGTVGSDGSYQIKGNIPGLGMYQLRLGDLPNNVLLLTLTPKDNLKLSATANTFATAPKASGTSWAAVMTDYMIEITEFRTKQAELEANRAKYTEDQLMQQYLVLKAKIDQFAISRMRKDPGNAFNIVLSTYAVPPMNFEDWDPANLDLLRQVSDAFAKKYKDSPIAETLSAQVYQIDLAYQDHLANASGTRTAPEIALKNPEGQEIRLSSLRGKYVLIDFWASWCAPCRQESPNVVRLYNKYKDRGFTVYSVSLDDNRDAWKAAIVKDGLAWPNHVSDLLQWKSPMPQLYGFTGIPHTVLVNPEGKIIGTALRGPALEQKLKEIFEK